MNKQKFVYVLLTLMFLVINSSVVTAFQTAVATGNKTVVANADDDTDDRKKEKIVKLIEQLERLSQETQSYNLFSNRVYFSVLTALDLYSAAALLDKYNAQNADGSNSANRKPVAGSYKTYLYQVVNQQKAALDGALDATLSEHNKLFSQAKNSDTGNGNNAEAIVPEKTKTIFDLAGVNVNLSDTDNLGNAGNRLYLLVSLKSYTSYAIGEIDPELAFDFYEHDPINSLDLQMQQYITADLAEKRANFVNKLFEKEPEKAIAKLTNLKEKPINFLTSEALASFYKKDSKKAAQFAQKILNESFAGLDTEDENILYQKMNTYLYLLSYLKDSKLLTRNNPLITKSQAQKIVDLLVNFYSAKDSDESGGSDFLYVADIISDFSPEKANLLLQSSDYQIKPKKKNPSADNITPFTYDAPIETPPNQANGSGTAGEMTIAKPDPPAPPPAKPENNKPAPETINQYYNQALQMSNYNVSEAVYVGNLIKISKVFNNWGDFEKAQSILGLAQNTVSKSPATNSDYVIRLNLAQAYMDSKNTPEAVKITENALGAFEYFIQGLITTSRYNRDGNNEFTDNGYELDASLNSYYAYYLQSIISSNATLFNNLMNENPEATLNLSNKFTRKESQFVFKYYVLDGYLKYLQTSVKP